MKIKKLSLPVCALFAALLIGCQSAETGTENSGTRLENPFAADTQTSAVSTDKLEAPDTTAAETSGDTTDISDVTAEPETDSSPDTDETDAPDTTVKDTEKVPETEEPAPGTPPTYAGEEVARISFVAAGDNVIHKCIWRDAEIRAQQTGYKRAFDFKPTYADVTSYIKSFDLAFVNQETILGGVELELQSYPDFNSPTEVGLDLKELGFDIVNIATNHMADQSDEGLLNTIELFESSAMDGVTLLGAYQNREDYDNIRTVNKEGVEIALLSYTYGANGKSYTSGSELVIPRINDKDMIRQCALAEEAGDITVVSVHWGHENDSKPTAEQRRVAQLLAENGADVIIGHHPHVLQPIEWIETDHGYTLVIYSLGNLISGMAEWENMLGGFASFDIVAYSDGTISVENVKFVPTAFYFGANHLGSHLYFLKDYTNELAEKHGVATYYNNESATPKQMLDYANSILGDYLVLKP